MSSKSKTDSGEGVEVSRSSDRVGLVAVKDNFRSTIGGGFGMVATAFAGFGLVGVVARLVWEGCGSARLISAGVMDLSGVAVVEFAGGGKYG